MRERFRATTVSEPGGRGGGMVLAWLVIALIGPVIGLAPLAAAQTLNLDQGAGSGPGKAALALAGAMDDEGKRISKVASASAGERVRAALARVARGLLREGDRAGLKGSVRVLAGRTIATRLVRRDAAIDARFGVIDAITLRGVARDLDSIDAASLGDPAVLDRVLRDALAPLLEACVPLGPGAGWLDFGAGASVVEPSGGPSSLAGLAEELKLSPESSERFAALDARLRAGERWAAYRPAAAQVRADILSAARVAGAVRPAWLSDEAYGKLRVELVHVVTTLAAPGAAGADVASNEEHERAGRALQRLAALADAVSAADAVDAAGSGRSTRTTRAAINEVVLAPMWASDQSAQRRFEDVARTLRVVARGAAAIPDAALVRALRPALAALEPAARQASVQLLDVVPRIVRANDAMSDPAVLGAIAAHDRRVGDVRAAVTISSGLSAGGASVKSAAPGKPGKQSGPEPLVTEPLRALGERALVLAQDMSKAAKRETAIVEFRALDVELRDYVSIPGERELRAELQAGAAAGEWSVMTGGKQKQLAAALDEVRSRWLSEHSTPKVKPNPRTALRLALLRTSIDVLRDGAAAQTILNNAKDDRLGDAMQAWPGWELSPAALRVLLAGLSERTARAVEQLVANNDDAGGQTLSMIQSDYAAALLVGRLDRLAASTHLSGGKDPVGDALAQVALGPPGAGAWLGESREGLAAVCCQAEELAWAESHPDPKQGAILKSLRSLVNRTAGSIRIEE